MPLLISVCFILLTISLSGCGKKNDLTLPETPSEKQQASSLSESTPSLQANLRLINDQETK